MDLFRELNKAGSTILLITHDQQLAQQANRTVHIHDGILSHDAPVETQSIDGRPEHPAAQVQLQYGVSP